MKTVPNILIVDDDPVDREVYKRLLAQNHDVDCKIYEAETGKEGVEYCKAGIPDCVLLDYSIPDIDGLEFLDKIANQTGKTDIPVIMLTGLGNEHVAVQAVKKGVDDYLIKKELTGKTLWDAIRKALHTTEEKVERVTTSAENPGVPMNTWVRV